MGNTKAIDSQAKFVKIWERERENNKKEKKWVNKKSQEETSCEIPKRLISQAKFVKIKQKVCVCERERERERERKRAWDMLLTAKFQLFSLALFS